MRFLLYAFLVVAGLIAPGMTCAQTLAAPDGLAPIAAMLTSHDAPQPSGPALTLDEAQRIALAANPEIAVAVRRVAIAEAQTRSAGALDDPMAMYRGWAVPLQKPWDYNAAQNMFSVSQTFPGFGKRGLRTSVAQSGVDVARAKLAQVRFEVQIRVRKAFNDLLVAQDELRIHDQHVEIARQAIEAARIKYSVGKVSQQDILKAQVALTGLAQHMFRFGRDADVARARLNTLLGRDPDAALDIEGHYAVMDTLPAASVLRAIALHSRPDLAAAGLAAEQSHKAQALAGRAYAPDFTVSAGYMLMPAGTNMRNNYMLEGSMNLPWLNHRKHDAEIAEAAATATGQDAELAAMRNAAFGEIQDALIEARAAQQLARMYHDQLRPQAETTFQASVIAYENNKTDFLDLLDSQMTVIDIDLNWFQAVGDFNARLADLELASGAPLDSQPQPTSEVKP